MGYEDIIRNAIAGVMVPQLESMNGDVIHYAWVSDNGKGKDEFAAPVARRALIDITKRGRATQYGGRIVMTYANLTFLSPVPDTQPSTGKVRENPFDPRDKLVLPDGGTAPIVQAGGPFDSGTDRPFIQEVVLGTVVRGQ